jgi:hypothetical protein
VTDEELEAAKRIRDCMGGWVTRMAGSAAAGRSATTVARMATAKAIAELRNIKVAEGATEGNEAVFAYLRRSRSILSQAAQDIERNRYSLEQMDGQMQRLDEKAKVIFPEEATPLEDGKGEADSVEPAGGADDRGADREVSASQ